MQTLTIKKAIFLVPWAWRGCKDIKRKEAGGEMRSEPDKKMWKNTGKCGLNLWDLKKKIADLS